MMKKKSIDFSWSSFGYFYVNNGRAAAAVVVVWDLYGGGPSRRVPPAEVGVTTDDSLLAFSFPLISDLFSTHWDEYT